MGACARWRSWAGRRGWALCVGGKCGLVLHARWGGHGSLTRSPPGSSGPGHHILLVTETRYLPVPRLRTHGDGCAPGTTWGDPPSLTACRHRWRRRTSWVPHSHSLGRRWQVEGSLGALSASLPWDLPGKVPACGAAASVVLGARRAHHRTGPSNGEGGGGGGAGVGRWLSSLQGSPTTALECRGGGRVVEGSTCPLFGSWCSLVWERRTTCWVTMWVPHPNILVVRRPLPFREGRDLDHHVSACSEGARACLGGGGGGGVCQASVPPTMPGFGFGPRDTINKRPVFPVALGISTPRANKHQREFLSTHSRYVGVCCYNKPQKLALTISCHVHRRVAQQAVLFRCQKHLLRFRHAQLDGAYMPSWRRLGHNSCGDHDGGLIHR